MGRTRRRRKTTAVHRLLTVLFVLVFPVTLLSWIGFGVGFAMVAVLDADAPTPPSASSVPLPDGWSVVDDKKCETKDCSTRVVVVEAPVGAEVVPPARRLIASLKDRGWRVDPDTPAVAESPDGITVNAEPPAPLVPDPANPGDPNASTTTAAPPTTRTGASSSTSSTTTTVPQTTTTVSAAVAARRAAVTVGFRSEASGRAYHREGVAMQHITGFYRFLAILSATTVALGLLLFVLDQFVS